jgi:hypothetical protein
VFNLNIKKNLGGKWTSALSAGLAIKNPPNKTQKTPALKNHLKAVFLGFIVFFLKLTSIFGAKVTIFLIKCLCKSFYLL